MSGENERFCHFCGNSLIDGGICYICEKCRSSWNKSSFKKLDEEEEIFFDSRDCENELFLWLAEELSIHSKSVDICTAIDKAFQKNKFSLNFCKKI